MNFNNLVKVSFHILILTFIMYGCRKTGHAESLHELKADGIRFTLDDQPFDMWGIRVGSAAIEEEYTSHLIDQLDEYMAHGVNSLAVYYMGTHAGYANSFPSPDGTVLDQDHHRRMVRIIEEAAKRDMVVIVGIFYQRVEPALQDAEAVRQAVRTVTRELLPYRNVIINIANEHNSHWYESTGFNDIFNMHDPERVLELCAIVHEVDPDRLVGAGGYDHDNNVTLGLSPHMDVLLFDTSTDRLSSGELYQRFRADGVTNKPIVNVETFGGWTANWPPGEFPDSVKASYYREIEDAASEPGLSVFMHNNSWMQGPGEGHPLRYDLAGYGTEEDPGIRWYFEAVREARGLN
ncbi:MAG: hypothetical protein ACLFQA_06735 [Bacteroidales bacterium]